MKMVFSQAPMACLVALLLCACSPRTAAPAGVDPVIADSLASSGKVEFSCPLSKDNYYFAVRAVSADGHPGLPGVAQ